MSLIEYVSQSQQKQRALRRTMGVQLFACRQQLRQTLMHVQEAILTAKKTPEKASILKVKHKRK